MGDARQRIGTQSCAVDVGLRVCGFVGCCLMWKFGGAGDGVTDFLSVYQPIKWANHDAAKLFSLAISGGSSGILPKI
jgi:hypothetical protein